MNANIDTEAKDYTQINNAGTRTVACVTCGELVPLDGNHCVALGVYQCGDCWKKKPCFES